MNDTPFVDPAAPILAGEPTINDEQRAALWDVFHGSKSPEELAVKLQPLSVPNDLKQQLFSAKKSTSPTPKPLEGAVKAINVLRNMDPDSLALVEKYPNAAKALISAAEKGVENEAGKAADKQGAQGKGVAAGTSKKTQPLAQPPRADGLEHLPPIPENHYRVLASDGGIHDIPAENIETARGIDPTLHVLNP